jgi:DNA-binding XRE family transcriptional regulator
MPTTGSGQKRNRSRAKSQSVDQKWVIFGKRIADLRKDRGWLAYEVAKMIDVDPATISQLENGRRATGPLRSLDR